MKWIYIYIYIYIHIRHRARRAPVECSKAGAGLQVRWLLVWDGGFAGLLVGGGSGRFCLVF